MSKVKDAGNSPAEILGENDKPSTGFTTLPDWQYWSQMPHEVLWKVVALSCNIEPRRVRLADTNYWIDRARWGDAEHHERDRQFSDRLEIATARLNELEHASLSMGNASEPRIKLPEFAAWTLLMNWKIPVQLADMASAASKSTKSAVKSENLSTTERGTVQKLVAGFLAQGYSHDKLSKPYAIAKEIQSSLQSAGLNLSDDTIVLWIKEATPLLVSTNKKPGESR